MRFKKLTSAALSAFLVLQTFSFPAYASYEQGETGNPVIESAESTAAESTAAVPEEEIPEAEAPAEEVPDAEVPNMEVPDEEVQAETPEDEAPAEEEAPHAAGSVQLQSGSAFISSEASDEEIRQILFDALAVNKDGIDPQSLNWEFYGNGSDVTGLSHAQNWVSVLEGGSWETGKWIKVEYSCSNLKSQPAGTYRVRISGTSNEVNFTKADKSISSVSLNSGVSVALPYTAEGQLDTAALYTAVFSQLIDQITPELTQDEVKIEYYATAETGAVGSMGKNWVPLEGGTVNLLNYPAVSAGEQKIRVSWGGNAQYKGFSAEATVSFAERPQAPYELNDPVGAARLSINDDLSYNYDAIRENVFNAVIASSDVIKNDENINIEYYATAVTGTVGSIGKNWVPLQGGKAAGLSYPAVSEGTWRVRISYKGSSEYAPAVIESEVQFIDRPEAVITEKAPGSVYETGIVFYDDMSCSYEATARAIYDAVVESAKAVAEDGTETAIPYEAMHIAYNTDKTGITKNFVSLSESDLTGLVKFGIGSWEIRISCSSTLSYRGSDIIVRVNIVDNRLPSAIVFKEGSRITYNMNADSMKQDILSSCIDYEASQLPSADTLSIDNFEFQYKGSSLLTEGVPADWQPQKGWAPVEGGQGCEIANIAFPYPQMGAGENQEIRISFKGNADYRPSEAPQEGVVSVNKAHVGISVRTTNTVVGNGIPADMVTLNPADPKIDVYTVYGGLTSDVTTCIYLELPAKYSQNSLLIKFIDPVVQSIYGKSFSQILNEGMTLGELRSFLSNDALLDALDKMNVDTGSVRQIITVLNKLPSVTDSVTVAFGTPANNAGLYVVTAVTENKNYETAVGTGILMVRMSTTGNKIVWNQQLPRKITVEQAKDFDFGAVLSHDGDTSVEQNLHVLYSGFTSRWRPYSSTTTPPTEPGRYVMTVVTLGGNYIAAPVTRSFQIVK